jgi:hypothetical protein
MVTYRQVGLDPEPALLAHIPQSIVVQEILKHTATTRQTVFQLGLEHF